jgi:WD40 repeat protein
VTPNGKQAISASFDGGLKVWDLKTGRTLRTLKGHSLEVNDVAIAPDGKRALSASRDKTLKLWDLDTGHPCRTLESHAGSVKGVGIAPTGNRAVSASDDKTVKLWDLHSGLLMATFHCDAPALCCAFADSQRILAGDAVGRLYILSVEESPVPG